MDKDDWMMGELRPCLPPTVSPPAQMAMWAFEQARAILPRGSDLEDVREAAQAILKDVVEFALASAPPLVVRP